MRLRRAAVCGAVATAVLAAPVTAATADASGGTAASTRTAGVTLWNTLGSIAHVQDSRIGPAGTVTGGSYVPGRFGNAYRAYHTQDFKLSFPGGVVNRYAGTIELWAKLSGFTPAIQGDGGAQPVFFTLHDPVKGDLRYLGLTANDGAGGGGLAGGAGSGNETATGPYGSWTYQQVLGSNITGWHHYALVWNSAGIRGVGDGKRVVAVFVDGRLSSTYWRGAPAPFPVIGPRDVLRLASINRVEKGAVTIDNLIVWNCAVTDFAARNTAKPGLRTCS